MAQKRVKTRSTGVYYRESTDPNRRHNGRPDRSFDYCFRDENGKLKWENAGWLSAGMTEQAAANIRAERVNSIRIPSARKLSQPEQQITGQQPVADPPQQQEIAEAPLFSSIAESYLQWLECESKYADRERFRYDTHLSGSLGNLRADAITITMANSLKHALTPQMAIGTVKKCLNLCRAIFYHASVNGLYTGLNPFSRQSGFKQPQGATECERFLTPGEAYILLEELAKRSPQLHDMCRVSLATGIRPCEIFSLRGGDLVPQAGFFWVDSKGGDRDKVPTNERIMSLLMSYKRKPHEYIFQTKHGDKIKQTSDTLRRTVEDLGLSPRTVVKVGRKEVRIQMTPKQRKEYNRQKIWMHTFRHTFASWLAQTGTVTLLELRDLLRHESTQMTERYAHLIPGSKEQQSDMILDMVQPPTSITV